MLVPRQSRSQGTPAPTQPGLGTEQLGPLTFLPATLQDSEAEHPCPAPRDALPWCGVSHSPRGFHAAVWLAAFLHLPPSWGYFSAGAKSSLGGAVPRMEGWDSGWPPAPRLW